MRLHYQLVGSPRECHADDAVATDREYRPKPSTDMQALQCELIVGWLEHPPDVYESQE